MHFTIGGNSGQYGDRTPAVFHCADGLVVISAIDGKAGIWSPKKILEAGKWYSFLISQILVKNEVTTLPYRFCGWV